METLRVELAMFELSCLMTVTNKNDYNNSQRSCPGLCHNLIHKQTWTRVGWISTWPCRHEQDEVWILNWRVVKCLGFPRSCPNNRSVILLHHLGLVSYHAFLEPLSWRLRITEWVQLYSSWELKEKDNRTPWTTCLSDNATEFSTRHSLVMQNALKAWFLTASLIYISAEAQQTMTVFYNAACVALYPDSV